MTGIQCDTLFLENCKKVKIEEQLKNQQFQTFLPVENRLLKYAASELRPKQKKNYSRGKSMKQKLFEMGQVTVQVTSPSFL